jgi:hypothetical protein
MGEVPRPGRDTAGCVEIERFQFELAGSGDEVAGATAPYNLRRVAGSPGVCGVRCDLLCSPRKSCTRKGP